MGPPVMVIRVVAVGGDGSDGTRMEQKSHKHGTCKFVCIYAYKYIDNSMYNVIQCICICIYIYIYVR